MRTLSSGSSSHQLTMDASKVNRSCDFCRRRKKKCDNGHPCANCRNSQNTCIYSAPKQRKRRSKTKLETQSTAIETLNLRISNLESLLLNLTTKLDKSLVNNDGVSQFRRSLKIQNPLTASTQSESSEDYSSSDGEKGNSSKDSSRSNSNPSTVSHVESSFSMSNSESSSLTCARSCSVVAGTKNIHPSVVCILSEKSLLWMKKRLRDNVKMITPLLNLPRAFSNSMKTLSEIWVNNPPKLTYKSTRASQELICSDPDIVHGLLFSYYHTQNVSTYCSLDQLLPLFRRYFHNHKGMHPVHQFSSSELLLMNVSLALCASNRSYIDQAAMQAYPALAQLNSKSLSELKVRCFHNSIVHFKKVQAAHEGYITVQALILLVSYVEYNYATDFEVFRMFCSSLIKCAQDVKLHQASTFAGLSPQEGYFRRNLWSYCELLDTELCYRCGDASLIQSDEVTTFTEFDDHIFSVPKVPFASNSGPTQEDVNRVIESCRRSESGAASYFSYFTLIYTRIRKANYQLLYGQCNDSKFSANDEVILTLIERANEQMCKLSNLMDESVRPIFYSDPKFDGYVTVPDDSSLLAYPGSTKLGVNQLSVVFKTLFFTHLSTLNKIPILFYYKNAPGERVQRLGDLSLESARTVLRMSAYIESCPPEHISSFAGGICFYPLMSYLTIAGQVLHYPLSETTHSDCLSLIEVSKLYAKCSYEDAQARQGEFASPSSISSDSPPSHTTRLDESHFSLSKLTLMDLFTRILLRPVIELMANETAHDYCKEIEGLSDFLNGSENLFPDLFVQDNPNVNFIMSKKPDDSPRTPMTTENPARFSLKSSYHGNYGSPLDFFNSSSPHDTGLREEGIIEEIIPQPNQVFSEFNSNHVMSDSQFYDVFGEDDFMKLLNSQFYTYPNFRLDSLGEEAV